VDRQRARLLTAAATKTLKWRRERDTLIVREHQAGAGLRELGRLTGLSHPAVKKIVDKHAAGTARDPLSPHEPDGRCGDLHCYFHHVDEPREPGDLICGECGHVFGSPEKLRAAWLANMPPEMAGQDAPPADEITFCPLCAHDF